MSKELPSIKQIVAGNRAHFSKLRGDYMYWIVTVPMFGVYEFPIPLEDRGDATWDVNMNAITLMRWIRQSLDNETFVHVKLGDDINQIEGS